MDWKKYGFVLASSSRRKVLLTLKDKPMIPSQVSKIIKMHLSHVSRTLKELEEKGLVICLTPDMVKGKIYRLTKTGKAIANKIIP
ncbi:MAG: helix-turn-helix domain-containing protein [Candidatus Aenigmarchaeota archaeon]|nr:helix-turn-helix domain-containing protein [Candidatus Aenigmarchaeota archaeon]